MSDCAEVQKQKYRQKQKGLREKFRSLIYDTPGGTRSEKTFCSRTL
ncbi:hypothetical protein BRYFOR_05802 [Marvinbryantia formatexigens DSM 14469]|uniref:Uncharacterized protein n=1 Tax=Marvinbryantia formatexigens DSM 14469 TaxID=478749 RepID=C6LB07_9FIRM|nr:hypothetical protein BRYFOR_05802 [Marvinbryantia formatexigens DSM 14469]